MLRKNYGHSRMFHLCKSSWALRRDCAVVSEQYSCRRCSGRKSLKLIQKTWILSRSSYYTFIVCLSLKRSIILRMRKNFRCIRAEPWKGEVDRRGLFQYLTCLYLANVGVHQILSTLDIQTWWSQVQSYRVYQLETHVYILTNDLDLNVPPFFAGGRLR